MQIIILVFVAMVAADQPTIVRQAIDTNADGSYKHR